MKIWLDDVRKKPTEYDVHVMTATDAIRLLSTRCVTEISLDHDLGDPVNGSGYDVAKWIEEQAFQGALRRVIWHIHSANPVGVKNMRDALLQAEKFWEQQP